MSTKISVNRLFHCSQLGIDQEFDQRKENEWPQYYLTIKAIQFNFHALK